MPGGLCARQPAALHAGPARGAGLQARAAPVPSAALHPLPPSSPPCPPLPQNILVFDLGGGTFDVSILTIDSGVFEVRCRKPARPAARVFACLPIRQQPAWP